MDIWLNVGFAVGTLLLTASLFVPQWRIPAALAFALAPIIGFGFGAVRMRLVAAKAARMPREDGQSVPPERD